jgi:hypothetical protein
MSIPTPAGRRCGALVARLLAGGYGALCLAHAQALRAAGVTGTPPPNAGAIKKFVATLQDNALWMIGTTAVLAITLIGALFFFGHTRAQDLAAKVAIGALIVISAGGIAA